MTDQTKKPAAATYTFRDRLIENYSNTLLAHDLTRPESGRLGPVWIATTACQIADVVLAARAAPVVTASASDLTKASGGAE